MTAIGVGRTRVPLRTFYIGMLVLLYLPIAVLFVFSFGTGTTLSFPLSGLTLDWYAEVLDNGAMIDAARNSLVVGVAAATTATAAGSPPPRSPSPTSSRQRPTSSATRSPGCRSRSRVAAPTSSPPPTGPAPRRCGAIAPLISFADRQ